MAPDRAGGAHGRSWWLATGEDVPTVDVHDLGGRRPDVVVVGLGASGLEGVVRLAERGADVVGLDAVGVAAGAAGANGGFVLAGLAHFHHDAVRLLGRRTAVAWWRRTEAELDRVLAAEPTARRVGSLRIAASPEEERDTRAQLAALQDDGLPAVAYDGPEGVGLLVAVDGVVDPAARCRRLAARAVAAGATLVAPAPVLDIRTAAAPVRVRGRRNAGEPSRPPAAAGPAPRRGISPTGSTSLVVGAAPEPVVLPARRVLVCVDGGLEHLTVDGRQPDALATVRSARLQMLATAPDGGLSLPRPVYRRWGLDYVQQRPSGEVLLGGGRDVGEEAEWAPTADQRLPAATPSGQVQAHLDRWLTALGGRAPVTHRWAAWAAFTADRLPIDVEVAPGVRVLGGYSGHGNLIGGMLARDAADVLLDTR